MMDIAIVGAGVAGSSLYRLITSSQENSRMQVDLYSRPESHRCGIHPCGWMTHVPDFYHIMDTFALPGERYILQPFSRMNFDGFPIKCDLATIDKPKLLHDLRGLTAIREDPVDMDAYDVVVDCTGAARAFLPEVTDDLVSSTMQYQVHRESTSPADLLPIIRFVKVGYAWSFPLDPTHLHIGVGSLCEELPAALDRTGLLRQDDVKLCGCRSRIRIGAPHRMLPFHRGNIWGVGECIGTVSPLVGDGIIPSIECASMFADHLLNETLEQYQEDVLTRFAWMEEERKVIDRMIAHEGRFGLGDLYVMCNHAQRFGLRLSSSWILSWMSGKRSTGKAECIPVP
jgi:flavin-dependent dehydrogenase